MEPRTGGGPQSLDDWVAYAKRGNLVFGLVWGMEHRPVRDCCVEALADKHRQRPKKFLLIWVKDTWEELVAAWETRIRNFIRLVAVAKDTEHPTAEHAKACFWAPGPDKMPLGRFPNEVFALEDPNALFQVRVMSRMERAENEFMEESIAAKLYPSRVKKQERPLKAGALEHAEGRGG